MTFRVCLALLLVALIAPQPTAAADKVIARFSGTGNTVTKEFETKGAFEVRWQTERAGDFRILLKGFPGGIPSIVADPATQGGPGDLRTGSVGYVRAGQYSFEVRASGPWQIEVVDDR
jgi:hypothetical protein